MSKAPAPEQRHAKAVGDAPAGESPAGKRSFRDSLGHADPAEAEIDAALAEFGGDARAAIGALLHDLAVLAADAAASTSRGYVRGRIAGIRRRESTARP